MSLGSESLKSGVKGKNRLLLTSDSRLPDSRLQTFKLWTQSHHSTA
jgi:hypothetical protein